MENLKTTRKRQLACLYVEALLGHDVCVDGSNIRTVSFRAGSTMAWRR